MSKQVSSSSREGKDLPNGGKEKIHVISFAITDVPATTEPFVKCGVSLLRLEHCAVEMKGTGNASKWEQSKTIIDLQFQGSRLPHEIFHPDIDDAKHILVYRLETRHAD